MGPITIFDKSFLQSLSVDESVWFDKFFLSNICPLFYIETLADLEKSLKNGRTSDEVVGIIAKKFPEMSGSPSAFHVDLCIANLLGQNIPMTWRIPLRRGKRVKVDGKEGAVYGLSPEAEAFMRWQKREFLDIERSFAKSWRQVLSSLDLKKMVKGFEAIGVGNETCKTLEDAKAIAENVVSSQDMMFDRIRLCFLFLGVPRRIQHQVLKRWITAGYPPLTNYAPYAAYVMMVEVFFQVALRANLISSERVSNKIDIGYLFYLPFSMIFVSSDRLHARCAPLFLRDDQEFVWGEDLKADLKKLNNYYSALPNTIKEKGIMTFASEPPCEGEYLVTSLWDRNFPGWRERKKKHIPKEAIENAEFIEELDKIIEAPALKQEEATDESQDVDMMLIQRSVHKKKGSWWQIPKDLKDSKKG